jgi:hypothetical protein
MITVTDLIVLMLAYAGISLSGICLIWQLRTKDADRAGPKRVRFRGIEAL